MKELFVIGGTRLFFILLIVLRSFHTLDKRGGVELGLCKLDILLVALQTTHGANVVDLRDLRFGAVLVLTYSIIG
jgi:hypothetical protein